jgi:hypothetical protein
VKADPVDSREHKHDWIYQFQFHTAEASTTFSSFDDFVQSGGQIRLICYGGNAKFIPLVWLIIYRQALTPGVNSVRGGLEAGSKLAQRLPLVRTVRDHCVRGLLSIEAETD